MLRFTTRLVMALVVACAMQGCTPNGDLALNPVGDSEYESVKKLRSGDYTLIANQELAELRKEADLGKSVGRYQINREGFRTWRLDTATGSTCLLLTSAEDWKKPDTAAEACPN